MASIDSMNSIVEAFRETAQLRSQQIAIQATGCSLTFEALDLRSDRVAAKLADTGVKKGDRIALYCINSEAFVVAYLGIVKAGATVVPVNLLLPAGEILYVLNDAEVSGLIYHELFAEISATLRRELSSLAFSVVIGNDDDALPWTDFVENDLSVPQVRFSPEEDVVVIIYTSGTTGHPKGAMLTHRNLLSNTSSVLESLQLEPGSDALLVVLPMFHSFAATVGVLTPLLHGCCIVPVPKFDIHLVANEIDANQATIFMAVPTMYGMLLDLPDEDIAKFATIRHCISGGASMPLPIMEQFEKRFGKLIYEGDGPTECSPVTCVNPIGGLRKLGSVGLPIPNVEMCILNDHGDSVPDTELGEICVRGPNVMKGYWKRPEATAEAFFADWYRTGDIGYCDDDGYFYIVDRIKDMLIVNGMNVYPKMVEDVIYQCGGVREAAVIGEPDELHGELPIAYVACDAASIVSEQSIREYCEAHLAGFQVPRKVVFMDDLPKTPTGKILKRELRQVDTH
ncbi:long-chain fatty acid--CoA ligase [Pseudomonadota bacterium]